MLLVFHWVEKGQGTFFEQGLLLFVNVVYVIMSMLFSSHVLKGSIVWLRHFILAPRQAPQLQMQCCAGISMKLVNHSFGNLHQKGIEADEQFPYILVTGDFFYLMDFCLSKP